MAIRYKLNKGYKGDVKPFYFKEEYILIGKIEEGQPTKWIPQFEENKDYREYLEWVAEGNTPEPADE